MKLVVAVYASQVAFEPSADGLDLGDTTFFKFLDYWICATSKALSFTIDCPSERFVLFGCCSLLPEKSK